MTDHRLSSYGVLLLRLALGTMFIAHSVIYMLFTLTLSGTSKFFNSIGLPSWLAYATVLAEAIGGILLILGLARSWGELSGIAGTNDLVIYYLNPKLRGGAGP